MRPFTREDLRVLLSAHDAPCLTLYMPRGAGGPAEHSLRFRRLLKDAERTGDRFDRTALRQVVAKVADLDTPDFWNDLRTTLAVFASPDFLETFRLGEPVAEATLVADTFLTKPLVKYLQGDVRYYLLTATRENVTLWEGGRESLDVVRVPEMPRGLRDLETARQKEATLGARQAGFGASVFYGGGGTDGKSDLRQLFRAVDRALMKVTHDERTPLILATFEQYHALFHEV
ncbi:MAG TPA: hypothetical protein VEI02_06825, partial [Planctomycetota bacterium]|nr:hypothetical protein [Planctomycetota bacterium]